MFYVKILEDRHYTLFVNVPQVDKLKLTFIDDYNVLKNEILFISDSNRANIQKLIERNDLEGIIKLMNNPNCRHKGDEV